MKITTTYLLTTLSLLLYANAESAECWDGYCKNGMCELQPHGTPYPCSPEQPCEKDGVYCFIDTYNYPEKGIISGCNGDWKPLALRYQLELDKEWDERVIREQKEGKLSLLVERWLEENEKRPDGEKRIVGEPSKKSDGKSRAVFVDRKGGDGKSKVEKKDDEKKSKVAESEEKDGEKSEVIEMTASDEGESDDGEKTKCTCGGNKSKCACEAGTCGCNKSATSDEKTKCSCGGNKSKCACEPDKCACAANDESGEGDQHSSSSHSEL